MNFLKERNIEYVEYKRPIKHINREEIIDAPIEISSGKIEFQNRTNRMML